MNLLPVSLMLPPHFIVGKTEAWREEMTHLNTGRNDSEPQHRFRAVSAGL